MGLRENTILSLKYNNKNQVDVNSSVTFLRSERFFENLFFIYSERCGFISFLLF